MQTTDLKAKRVLLIDDSDIAREAVGSILESGGWSYYDVGSPLGATSLIARLDIDILVVDMNMPVMSGSAFAQLVRNNPRFSDIKLVLITGDSREQLERIGEKTAADAILMKADLSDELLPTLERIATRPSPTARSGVAMVIDHDANERARAAAVLEALGFDVTTRASGRGSLAEVVVHRPEVVVVAADLPDLPGSAIVELIREHRATTSTNVVLSVEGSPVGAQELGDSCGASSVVRRGLQDEALHRYLARAVDR